MADSGIAAGSSKVEARSIISSASSGQASQGMRIEHSCAFWGEKHGCGVFERLGAPAYQVGSEQQRVPWCGSGRQNTKSEES